MTDASDELSLGRGGKLLTAMFVIVVLVTAFALIAAVLAFLVSNLIITSSVVQATQNLLDPEMKSLITKLEHLSQAGLDSGLMQFLFQIFSGAIVVAGVYLVDQSRKNLRKMKQRMVTLKGNFDDYNKEANKKAGELADTVKKMEGKAKNVEEHSDKITKVWAALQQAPMVWGLMGNMIQAHQTSLQLRNATDRKVLENNIPAAREAIDLLYRALLEAQTQKISLEKQQFDFFLDEWQVVDSNLKSVAERIEAVKEILHKWQECYALLKELAPQVHPSPA